MQASQLVRMALLLTLGVLNGCASQGTTPGTEPETAKDQDTYDKDTIMSEAEDFFGEGAAGLADVLNKVFSEKGRPNAYIAGEVIRTFRSAPSHRLSRMVG